MSLIWTLTTPPQIPYYIPIEKERNLMIEMVAARIKTGTLYIYIYIYILVITNFNSNCITLAA